MPGSKSHYRRFSLAAGADQSQAAAPNSSSHRRRLIMLATIMQCISFGQFYFWKRTQFCIFAPFTYSADKF